MPETSLLAILPVLPDNTSSGLKLRLYNNLRALQRHFRKIHVLGPGGENRPQGLQGMATWESIGADPETAFPHRIRAVLQADPDISHVLLEDPILIPHLENTGLDERRRLIVDMHNIESQLRFEIGQSLPSWRPLKRHKIRRDARAYRAMEDRVLTADCTIWVCSDTDRERLASRTAGRRIDVVPNIITDYPPTCPTPSEARLSRILYMGTYAYYPNRHAARYICRYVLPKLDHEISLYLVGHGPKGFMRRAARKHANLHVSGEVVSVKSYLQDCGILLMPIFQGGGTRLKALEACLNGLAIISTAKGVEGLGLVANEHYLEAENAEQFIAAIGEIRKHPGNAEKLTARAYRHVRENFTVPALERAVGESLG